MAGPLGLGKAARGAARYVADGVAETLWPTRCAGCEAPGALLCPECTAALPAIDQDRACRRCGAPFGSLVCTECNGCVARASDDGADGEEGPQDGLECLDAVCCYGVHEWPLDRLIRMYKDAGERRAAPLLGRMVVQAVERSHLLEGAPAAPAAPVPPAAPVSPGALSAPAPRVDAVTFVPCTPEAYARRGFDHMEAVARSVAEGLALPFLDALARRAPQDQRGLGRVGRTANARRSLVPVLPLDGARLLLVDDVLTTGATLSAAAAALRAGGAVWVAGATVARAW